MFMESLSNLMEKLTLQCTVTAVPSWKESNIKFSKLFYIRNNLQIGTKIHIHKSPLMTILAKILLITSFRRSALLNQHERPKHTQTWCGTWQIICIISYHYHLLNICYKQWYQTGGRTCEQLNIRQI